VAIPLAVVPAIPSGSSAAIKAILRPVAQDQIRPHTPVLLIYFMPI